MNLRCASIVTTVINCCFFLGSAAADCVRISQTDDLWYFNGATPAHFKVKVTLKAIGVPTMGTFKWEVTSGSSRALFAGGLTTTTISNDPNVVLVAYDGSASRNDVGIKLTYTPTSGPPETATHMTTVFMPDHLVHKTDNDNPFGDGYVSFIHYKTITKLSDEMTGHIEVSEHFTGPIASDQPNNWPRGDETASQGTFDAGDVYDRLRTSDVPSLPPLTPTPEHPHSGNEKVIHWPGIISEGSHTPAAGVQVLTLNWQHYRDHGRHF